MQQTPVQGQEVPGSHSHFPRTTQPYQVAGQPSPGYWAVGSPGSNVSTSSRTGYGFIPAAPAISHEATAINNAQSTSTLRQRRHGHNRRQKARQKRQENRDSDHAKADGTNEARKQKGNRRGRKPTQGKSNSKLVEFTKNMNQFASNGDVDQATMIFNTMISQQVWPSTVTFNVLIKAFVNAGRNREAEAILHDMEAQYNRKPDEGSFNTVVSGFAKTNEHEEALRVVKLCQLVGHSPLKGYSIVMRHYEPARILELLDFITQEGIVPDKVMLNSVLKRLCDSSPPMLREAIKLLERAKNNNNNFPSPDCIAYSIVAGAEGQQPEVAMSLLAEAKGENIDLDSMLYMSVINTLVSARPPQMTKALELKEDMTVKGFKPEVVLFNLIIKGYARTKPPNPELARAVLDEMVSKGLQPSIVTFSTLADVYCSAGDVENAEKLVREDMKRYQVFPNSATYNTLVKGYSRCRCRASKGFCKCEICYCSNPEAAVQLMLEMEQQNLLPNVRTVNTVLDAFCSSGEYERAQSIVEEVMKKPDSKCIPNTKTYNVLLNGWSRIQLRCFLEKFGKDKRKTRHECNTGMGGTSCGRDASGLSVDAGKEDMKKHIIAHVNELVQEMESRNVAPDQLTCNTIVNIYVVLGENEKAISTLNEMSERYSGIKRDTTSYNTIIKGAINISDADEAPALLEFVSKILETMTVNGVAPDIATFNSIAGTYAKAGYTAEAEKAVVALWSSKAQMKVSCAQHNKSGCCDNHKQSLFLAHDDFDENITEEEDTLPFEPDIITLQTLVRGYLSEDKPLEALRVLEVYVFTQKKWTRSALVASCTEQTCKALRTRGLLEAEERLHTLANQTLPLEQ